MSRRALTIAGLISLVALFGSGISYLLRVRFAAGDIYPEYSSLRTDPLGTKVYYEALQQLGSSTVDRNFRDPEHLPDGRNTALFIFALPSNELSVDEREYRRIERFVRGGGRIVVTLYPQFSKSRRFGTGTNSPAFKPQADRSSAPPIELDEKWGFGIAFAEIKRERDFGYRPVIVHSVARGMPESLSWHSALVFTNLSFDWRVIFAREADPVLIERRCGAGSIVLATDSFFVSNEAMQKERASSLLAWLPAGSRNILFDEVHLGVHEQPGIATLARRYHLHGGVLAVLAMAVLFVWKNTASFVPRAPLPIESLEVRGRESAAGFVNLLRRSISRDQLLQTCLNEWHKARQLDGRASPPKMDKIRATVDAYNSAPKPDPVATYNEISTILNEHTTSHTNA